MKKEIIKITEDFQIPDTNIILEAGDKIQVLSERSAKDFLDYSKEARDAAEELYDLFDRTMLRKIRMGKENPSSYQRVISKLAPEDREDALELAFDWAAEDSMSGARFPN